MPFFSQQNATSVLSGNDYVQEMDWRADEKICYHSGGIRYSNTGTVCYECGAPISSCADADVDSGSNNNNNNKNSGSSKSRCAMAFALGCAALLLFLILIHIHVAQQWRANLANGIKIGSVDALRAGPAWL